MVDTMVSSGPIAAPNPSARTVAVFWPSSILSNAFIAA